jgi:hypothetical protein
MESAISTIADSSKWQFRIQILIQSFIDNKTSTRCLTFKCFLIVIAHLAKIVHCERFRFTVNDLHSIFKILISDQRQNGSKDFLLHDLTVHTRIHNDCRQQILIFMSLWIANDNVSPMFLQVSTQSLLVEVIYYCSHILYILPITPKLLDVLF